MNDLAGKDALRVIGLMSGTSMDGIDAVLVEITGDAGAPQLRQLAYGSEPYAPALREELVAVASGEERSALDLCHLDHAVGDAFALAATRVQEEAGIEVDLVGSHGQTIAHDPHRLHTWQIGEPSRIAAAVGVPVVSDFRRADQAAGGQGAPLVPLMDALLFRDAERGRVLLNLGGIANVTVLPPGRGSDGVFAFDTGPGNVLLDEFLVKATGGAQTFDANGELAAAGDIDMDLLEGFLEHPYFRETPPKSTGREVFGAPFVALTLGEWQRRQERLEDIVATLTEFTALSVTESIRQYVEPHTKVDEVLVSGGGVHNATLMDRIRRDSSMPVQPLESIGFSSDAKEALAFALLARETVCGRAGNIPGATGASGPVVLGNVTPAPSPR